MQVFGSRGWVEVGDVEHLTTWEMRVCLVDPAEPLKRNRPETIRFPATSTERAELEHFARAALARQPLAVPGGDEVHNVAALEAILQSVREDGTRVAVARFKEQQ
jgi:predicted dehydrogenase